MFFKIVLRNFQNIFFKNRKTKAFQKTKKHKETKN